MSVIEAWLTFERRRVIIVAIVLATILSLPSLFCGFFGDDNLHLIIVEGTQKTVPGKPVQLAPDKDGEVYQAQPANVASGKTNNAAKS